MTYRHEPDPRYANTRSFFSDGPTDAYGSHHDGTGRRYGFLDPRTLGSDHDRQCQRVFGFVPKPQTYGGR